MQHDNSSSKPLLAVLAMLSMALPAEEVMSQNEKNHKDPAVTYSNPEFRVNELFAGYEDLRNPCFAELRARYGIDAVVQDVRGEFPRILALRHWIHMQIGIDNDNPTEIAHQTAFDILDSARQGGKFHCAHFRIVQQAVLNAYGYVTRSLGVGDGLLDQGRHHGVNEVWVNDLCKWVIVDAKYDLHFEKNGIPLSALEIRDEVLRNGGTEVKRVYGPGRKVGVDPVAANVAEAVGFYRWLSWEPTTSRTSDFPNAASSALIVLDDEYFQKNIWYRDGKPHWAYDADFFIKTTRRGWIEWTPNVIQHGMRMDGQTATIWLQSCTPNFSRYLIRHGDGAWMQCSDIMTLPVPRAGEDLEFQAENLAGVRGPVHRVLLVLTH